MSSNAFEHNGVMWHIDPLNKFNHVEPRHIVESVGYIPTFINPEADDVVKALALYGFGGPEMEGGIIEDDGTYKYPGDPELYPLCKGIAGEETIYIYQYGIIAFVSDERTIMYRFD